ncbi:PrpF protein [Tricharina praecox]|uniref:PrpF protein n=1 Tax=Tricharina praecox TaxID=43433 RepID=UPI00221F1130|nr:PrpF protein [Tricharina praecox]KAI5856898.1 PrpF protein [Tricharina praecox]
MPAFAARHIPRLARAFTTLNPLPATFIRGGTSKGIFIDAKHLPPSRDEWGPIFQGIMGSPDPFGRQLNGMGGGISSLSKICVVGCSTAKPETATGDYDIAYTFVQVGIRDGILDFSGNCGNLTAAIGIFALDEKLCRIPSLEMIPGETDLGRRKATLNLLNTNTGKIVCTQFPVERSTGLAMLNESEIAIAGVAGKGSRVVLEFLDPAGAKTGKLLPTGRPRDEVVLTSGQKVVVSCVDATNPTVFVAATHIFPSLDDFFAVSWPDAVFPTLEEIRQAAAVKMGLDPTTQAQPKICLVAPPSGTLDFCHIAAKALSMGALHKAIPSTVALCLAAAACVQGSVIHELVGDGNGDVGVEIPGGVVGLKARFEGERVTSVAIERTARKLMRGEVYW